MQKELFFLSELISPELPKYVCVSMCTSLSTTQATSYNITPYKFVFALVFLKRVGTLGVTVPETE